jgi:hypothetical protein
MPDRDISSGSFDERGEKKTQRALLAVLLREFPTQLTRDRLRTRGFREPATLEVAIRNLAVTGLLWCEGEVMLPTLAARHFDWLELS